MEFLLLLLLPLWLIALRRVLRDMARPSATGLHLACCGLPRRPLSASPARRIWRLFPSYRSASGAVPFA